jgi:thiamine transport system ATP-binding protein
MLRLEDLRYHIAGFDLSVDLTVQAGHRLAVLGPSGGGKSTLLNLIAGFSTPDAGRVMLAGQDVTDQPVPDRPLSILFQDGNLFPHLCAFDNVALGLRPDLRLTGDQRDRVSDALAQVGLSGLADRKPADLSGGQRSRVALARMLLRDKPLLLLDEPFAALDPGLRREMLDLVRDLCAARDLTLIMVSHDLRDAERICTDLLLLESGQVRLLAPMAEIAVNPPDALSPWR